MSISKNVASYCCEDMSKIENYDKAINDKTQPWDCHHRLEIQNGKNFSISDLKKMNLYYNRPASELIFLTHFEHVKLHSTGENNPFYGKEHSDKAKQKISDYNKGKHYSPKTEFKKGHIVSVETRMKISIKIREINEKRRNDKKKNNNI